MSVKPLQRNEIQGFSKGLITDVNPLNSQVDSTTDEANFEMYKDGTRGRRLGLDQELYAQHFETGLSWTELQLATTQTYLWSGVGGDPDTRFLVVQLGRKLSFYEINGGTQDQTTKAGEVELLVPNNASLGFGAIEGYLGVTSGTAEIYLISYDKLTRKFEQESFRIRIRDFFGIEETINPLYETDKGYRGPLNWQHYYNLYNQGWAIPRKDWEYGDPPAVDAVYLGSKKNPNDKAPSSHDTVWSGMSHKPTAKDSLENFEAFHYRQFEAITGADVATGKGFFLIDAFNRGSSRSEAWIQHRNKYPQTGNLAAGFSPPSDTTSGGPTSVAAHAGRLFYSGCKGQVTNGDSRSPNYNNYVFYTQLIKSRADFGKCYQEGDPTSRESSELVDTDGGYFTVSEAINLHTMYSMGGNLFLIAENGVWSVAGGSGYGFSGTNYKVDKLSTFGGIPGKSFVELGGTGFFWGYDGIYSISKNQYGDYIVENQSKKVIDKFYSKITSVARATCQGFVDKQRNLIRWVYTEGDLFDGGVSKELVMDLNFEAFYPFTISQHATNNAYLLSGVQTGEYSLKYITGRVVVGSDPVFHNDSPVIEMASSKTALASNVKYLTIWNTGGSLKLVFSEYRNENFEDWAFTGTPTDAYGYMETNAFTGGDFSIKKQAPYLSMAFAETEKTWGVVTGVDRESSCIGRVMWNFSHLARSGKWSREMQLYRKQRYYYGDYDIDNGFSINITKTKLRGIGRSLALRVETEPKKSCHIYGWNFSLTTNDVP